MLIGLFGTGRDGSSLIGRLLDGLESTYVHPVEEKFLTAFDDLSRCGRVTRLVEQNCTTRKLQALTTRLSKIEMRSYFSRSLREIYNHCQAVVGEPSKLPLLTFDDLFEDKTVGPESFVRNYLAGLGTRIRPDINFQHHLFKSIETPYIGEYAHLFPEMKFIHILRHPLAVCSSQKRSIMENKGLPASYLGYDNLICMLEKRWIPHADFIACNRDDQRHIVVLYEDLVQNPMQQIARIAERLGLQLPARPDVQTVFHDLDKVVWGFNPSKKGVQCPTEVVADLQRRHQYEEVLTQREIDLISYKTGRYLNLFGYDAPSKVSFKKLCLRFVTLEKSEIANCHTPRYWLRCLFGLFYRRATLFDSYKIY